MRRPRTLCLVATILAAPWTAAGPPMPSGQLPERWSAGDVTCPEGTELQRAESPRGDRSALWCEARAATGRRGSKVARHGPYLELYADGSTARQGLYVRGVQIGPWVEWGPGGERTRAVEIWPGEAGPHLPQPDDLCPPGSRRERSYGYDHEERMWSECLAPEPGGKLVRTGPYVTWSVRRNAGEVRLVLRDLVEYQDGERHGRHQAFEGPLRPGGRESLVLEENFDGGKLEGESRAYFLDGALREVRRYRDGLLDGERLAYRPAGGERWRAVYDRGRFAEARGDLEVAGQPCPDESLPVLSSDGLAEHCERRGGAWGTPHGAYVRHDGDGGVIERGLYEEGEKVEVWEASPGAEVLPSVPPGVPVARGRLLVGERPLSAVTGVEADVWFRDNVTRAYPHPDVEIVDDEVLVSGLAPGSYYLGVTVDADPANPERHPGDFTGSLDFEVVEGEVTPLDVRLLETLHLTEPWDNRRPIPGFDGACDETPALSPPVRVAWRPPQGGDDGRTEYFYTVRLMSCDPFQALRTVAEGTTWDPAVALELPQAGPGEVYSLHLGARRSGVPVGHLMVFGPEGGYGWDLRFRVEGEPR